VGRLDQNQIVLMPDQQQMVYPVADKDVDAGLVEKPRVNVVASTLRRRDDTRTNVDGVGITRAKRVQDRGGLPSTDPDVQGAMALAHVQVRNRSAQERTAQA